MRVRLISGWLLLLMLVAAIGYAQQPAPAPAAPAPTQVGRLSLAEALDIARRNNPAYRDAQNNRWAAVRGARTARLNLLTPYASVSSNMNYTLAGNRNAFFGDPVDFPTQKSTYSGLSLSYRLSGATIANIGLTSAAQRAADEEIAGALTLLETSVRAQYLTVLQMKAQEELARRTLERGREGLALAQARHAVGQTTLIDVRREEVNRGNAEVGLMRATRNVDNQILVLFQQLGVPAPPGVQLSDTFPVVEPQWSLDSLMSQALGENPALRALRAREASAAWAVRSARSTYLPTLSLSAERGRSSTTYGAIDTIPSQSTANTNPWAFRVSLSLPIYDGLQRNVEIARERAAQEDLRLAIRNRELAVQAEVTAAFNTLQLAYRTIAIQEANRIASNEALELATQRYRIGSGSYIDLLDARVTAERADADHIGAIYEYHRAIANLEYAVGRPLR